MSTITLTLTTTGVTAGATPAAVTASVTNAAAVPARVVLGAFAPAAEGGAAPAAATPWTTVDRPLREIGPGATEQYTVTIAPPDDTAAGEYAVRLIAYDADRPPEEYSDQARQVQLTVPAKEVKPTGGVGWWIYAIAGALVLVVGVVAFVLLRTGEPQPTPTPAPDNPCPAPFVPRLSRPGDQTCVMPASAEEAQWDNRSDVQRDRLLPGTTECAIPYVPRLAFADDLVCVWEDTANRTHVENQPGYTEHMFGDSEYPDTFTPRR